jgi:serine-type D-Ala-D-Ala carboxypeptidase/endopeptidase (penicillin-binding protein 4)
MADRTMTLGDTQRRLLFAAVTAASVGCSTSSRPTPAPTPDVVAAPAPPVPVVAPARTLRDDVQRLVDSLVGLPQFSNAHWGVLIVSPDRRDTLANVQADRLVMPASNQKIITGAVALTQLGARYHWPTTFLTTGPIRNGALVGDLLIAGSGDASVSAALRSDPLAAFDPVVAALRAAGVKRIRGQILASTPYAFPGSPLGFGWDWDDLDAPYGAGVAELVFNESFTDVVVTGCGRVGGNACAVTQPLANSPVIRSDVSVRAPSSGAPAITWWRDSGATPGIRVQGSIAAGDTMRFSASHPDPRAVYVAAARAALSRAGISVAGGRVAATRTDTLVVLQSLPLPQILAAMEKPSQNQIAEMMFRTLALRQTGVGTPDSARAVVERQLTAWGVRPDAHAVRDGSGLSRHNYITPRAIVQVLDAMRRSDVFEVFYEALPVAGKDGTLRNRMRAFADGRVRAKTGTIDKARALSGYITTRDGEILLFSLIANNHTVPNREVERIQDLIVEHLIALPRGAQ